jgi:hypothetical protein
MILRTSRPIGARPTPVLKASTKSQLVNSFLATCPHVGFADAYGVGDLGSTPMSAFGALRKLSLGDHAFCCTDWRAVRAQEKKCGAATRC